MHPYNIPTSSSPPPRAYTGAFSQLAKRNSGLYSTSPRRAPQAPTYLPRSLQCTIFGGEEKTVGPSRPHALLSQIPLHRANEGPFASPHIPLYFDVYSSASPLIKAAMPKDAVPPTHGSRNSVGNGGVPLDNVIRRKKLRTPKKVWMPPPTPPKRIASIDATLTPWTPMASVYDTDEGNEAEHHRTIRCSNDDPLSPLSDASPLAAPALESFSPVTCSPMEAVHGLDVQVSCTRSSAMLTPTKCSGAKPDNVSSPIVQSPIPQPTEELQRCQSLSIETQTDTTEITGEHFVAHGAAVDDMVTSVVQPPLEAPRSYCSLASMTSLLRHTAATMGGLEDRRVLLRYFLFWRLRQSIRERSVRRRREIGITSPSTPTAAGCDDVTTSQPPPPAPSAPTPPPPQRSPTTAALHRIDASPFTESKLLFTPSPIHDDDLRRSLAVTRIGRHDAVASQLTYDESDGAVNDTRIHSSGRAAPISRYFTKSIAGSSMNVTTVSHHFGSTNDAQLPPRAPFGGSAMLTRSFVRDLASARDDNGTEDDDDDVDEDDNSQQQEPMRIKFFHGSL
jgi:hypothetical protein